MRSSLLHSLVLVLALAAGAGGILCPASPAHASDDHGSDDHGGDDHGGDDHGGSTGSGGSGSSGSGGSGTGSSGSGGSGSGSSGSGGSGSGGSQTYRSPEERAREIVKSGLAKPFGAILPTVRENAPGDILNIRLVPSPQGYVYEVWVLARDGQNLVVRVEALRNKLIDVRKR